MPKITVVINPFFACEWLFSIILWWAHVTDTPLESKIIVLRSGIWKGLKGAMFLGGHLIPISIEGANLAWKKAQKKEAKNRTSEVIKRIIPRRIFVSTSNEWWPWKVASRVTSRHHWIEEKIRKNLPKMRRKEELLWNQLTVPAVTIKALKALVRGQGLWSTMWKGWKYTNDISYASEAYKVVNTENTYAWIQATAHSRSIRRDWEIIIIGNMIIILFIVWFPNKVKRRWPAIIFAAKRTERVIGRIIFLTSSIMTIKGIKAGGVPIGTKWAKNEVKLFTKLKIIKLSHKGRAKVKVIARWLVAVNVNERRPNVLLKIIIKNREMNSKIFIFFLLRRIINSFIIILMMVL